MSEVTQKRIYFIDYARAFAILLVVLCHVTEATFGAGQSHWFIYTFIHDFGRLGVPLFFMISGVLQLRKSVAPGEFYKKSILPLLLVSEVWIVINYAINSLYMGDSFTIQGLLGQVLFLGPLKLPHMWFIPEIIILYLMMPFIALVVKQFSLRKMLLPLGIMYVTCFVFPSVFGELGQADPSPLLYAPILGGMAGFYLLVGYYLSSSKITNKIKTRQLLLVLIISILLNFVLQCLMHNELQSVYPLDWYTNPFHVIMASLILILIKRFLDNKTKVYSVIRHISSATFGIFFLHYFVILILKNYLSGFGQLIWFSVALISSFAISCAIVVVTSKISKRLALRLFLYKA